jgi:aspartate aminotransferase-like enzyme
MPTSPKDIDPDRLLEYSVVYSERALNHMSPSFCQVMRDLSIQLKEVYAADAIAVVPGGGTFAMEAVARQFAQKQEVLVLRNGWFSYRWSQIFAAGGLVDSETVCQACPNSQDEQPQYKPAEIDAVVAEIRKNQPAVVFAAHVETSAGLILPDDYLRRVGQATRSVGGLFVLDCIASGACWVDMRACSVDVLISAPQKGWTATPCAGVVLMNERAVDRMDATQSDSFACDLKKWHQIMSRYEQGGHGYHATMPTDGLRAFRDVVLEAHSHGFDFLKQQQVALGREIRALCARRWTSLAAPAFAAPSVVVCYTDSIEEHTGRAFAALGMQIAAGVPLQCGEASPFRTFRVGLFGLDKLLHRERTVRCFEQLLDGL